MMIEAAATAEKERIRKELEEEARRRQEEAREKEEME